MSLGDHRWKDNKFKFVTVSKITFHEEEDNNPCEYEYSGYGGYDGGHDGGHDYEHPAPKLIFDVAILTLSQKIKLNSKISPICLPADNGEKSYAGKIGQVSGWGIDKDNFNINIDDWPGQPHELLVANVKIMSDEACKRAAMNFSDEGCAEYKCDSKCGASHQCFDLTCENVHPEEMCSMEHGSTCQGDSGGPLFLEEYHTYDNPQPNDGRDTSITVKR